MSKNDMKCGIFFKTLLQNRRGKGGKMKQYWQNSHRSSNRMMGVHYHATFVCIGKFFIIRSFFLRNRVILLRICEHFCPLKASVETRKNSEVLGT